jgi:predicted aspartyl protease
VLARRFLTLPLALMLAATSSSATSDIPRIGKPRPAPSTTPDVLPLPPAVIDNNLQIGGDNVKARAVDTRLSVDVRVNDRGPYHFVVDSGADTSVVGTRMAQALQLPLGTPVILNGMTGRNVVDRVKVAELTLGPTTVSDLEIPALREIDLGADGLVGIDALVNQRLMMDFEKHIIKVEDARIPMRHVPGEILILAKRRRGQLILTQVRASRFSLDAVIDTGSEITIGNTALRDKLLRKGRTQFWDVEATGVTGQKVVLHLARIDELQLGPVTLQDVPIAFADVPPFKVFGLADQPALLLGTDILGAFRRVSLDFAARKVRFQLRRCGSETIRINTSPTASLTSLSSGGNMEVCG